MLCQMCRTANATSVRYGNMPVCDGCWEKEQSLQAENMSPENQQARVDAANKVLEQKIEATRLQNETLRMAEKIDQSIEIKTDIFNAYTTAILDIKAAIDNDAAIENKPYRLAETIKTRFEHLSKVIFDTIQESDRIVRESTNEQRAIQSYLNSMANQLRAEEREALRIKDINYKPTEVKQPRVKTVKTTGTKQSKAPAHRQKIDKEALKKYAAEIGVPEFHLQQVVIQQGVSVEKAADIVREMIAKMRAASGQ